MLAAGDGSRRSNRKRHRRNGPTKPPGRHRPAAGRSGPARPGDARPSLDHSEPATLNPDWAHINAASLDGEETIELTTLAALIER